MKRSNHLVALWPALIAIVVMALAWVLYWNSSALTENKLTGLGQFLAGLTGSLFGAATLGLLIYTVLLNLHQIQQGEAAAQEQAKLMVRQTFEAGLFQLLGDVRAMLAGIEDVKNAEVTGYRALRKLHRDHKPATPEEYRKNFNTKLDNGTLYVRSVRVMLHYVKAHDDEGIDLEMYRGLISAAFSNHEKVCLALLGLNDPEFLALLKAGGAIQNPAVRVEPFLAWPEALLKAVQKA